MNKKKFWLFTFILRCIHPYLKLVLPNFYLILLFILEASSNYAVANKMKKKEICIFYREHLYYVNVKINSAE